MFTLTVKNKRTAPSETNSEVDRSDQTGLVCSPAEDDRACGPEIPGAFSSTLEGQGPGGGCEDMSGLELSRPGSEAYLTASEDSNSLFDDDMQRPERCGFHLLRASDGIQGGCKEVEKQTHKAKLEDCTSEELNKRFQSQRLDSSSSSSEPNTPSPILTPALTPKRPNPPQDQRDNPASPKQPCLRMPAGFRLNVSLAKKHLSQPPISTEAAHGQTRNALSMLRLFQPQETGLDQEQEVGMEMGRDTPSDVPPSSQATPIHPPLQNSFEHGTEMSLERQDCNISAHGNKPPTPPLHRLPSWVGMSSVNNVNSPNP